MSVPAKKYVSTGWQYLIFAQIGEHFVVLPHAGSAKSYLKLNDTTSRTCNDYVPLNASTIIVKCSCDFIGVQRLSPPMSKLTITDTILAAMQSDRHI